MKSPVKTFFFILLAGSPSFAETGELATPCADSTRLESLEQDCLMQSAVAAKACSERLDPGVKNVNAMGTAMAQALVGAASTTGACGRVADYGQALDTAITGFTTNCTEKHQNCKNVCAQLKTALAESKCDPLYLRYFSANLEMVTQTCDGLKDKTQEVRDQQQSQLAFMKQATNCAENTSATAQREKMSDCQVNPSAAGCQAPVTPQNSFATAPLPTAVDLNQNSTNATGPAESLASAKNLTAQVTSNRPLRLSPLPPTRPSVSPEVLAKQMALAARMNAGANNAAPLTSASSTTATSLASQGLESSTRGPASLPENKAGLRNIQGAAGPDGLTGPHTDLFAKVTNRYQVLKVTLLP